MNIWAAYKLYGVKFISKLIILDLRVYALNIGFIGSTNLILISYGAWGGTLRVIFYYVCMWLLFKYKLIKFRFVNGNIYRWMYLTIIRASILMRKN